MLCCKKLVFLCLLIIELGLPSAMGQTVEQTYAFAIQQYETGRFNAARMAFQRVLFFGGATYKAKSYQYVGQCYYSQGNFPAAASYFDLAYAASNSDSAKVELVFLRCNALLQDRQYQLALRDLFSLPTGLPEADEQRQALYLGIAYYGLDQLMEAEKQFAIILKDSTQHDQLHQLFIKAGKTKRLKPKLAKAMSMVVPGAGQFYSGHVREGFNSLLLTSSFLALTVTTAVNYTFLDAFLSVFPWYFRYYQGGLKNAEQLTEERIREKKAKVYREILKLVAGA